MNLLITKDEKDKALGTFLNKCACFATSLFEKSANIKLLPAEKLKNDVMFSITVNDSSFIPFNFFAFTHGNENGLIVDKQNYIGCDTTCTYWADANFIYNFSCLSACQFGKHVIRHGAKCFVGHNRAIYIQTLPKYQHYFFNPFKAFIVALSEKRTIEVCINNTKEKYTKEIDDLYVNDMLTASVLMENRDSMVCYGDSRITI